MNYRILLAGLLSFPGLLIIAGCAHIGRPGDGPEEFLASLRPDPVEFGTGGFAGINEHEADYSPENGTELVAILAELKSQPDEERSTIVIGLLPGRVYTLSGLRKPEDVRPHQSFFSVPAGVALAALKGEPAPVLRYEYPDNAPELLRGNAYGGRALLAIGENCRVLGLRIIGPDAPAHDADYGDLPRSRFSAISASENATVEHCTISGFHWGGVSARGRNVTVRGCDLFDIHAYPLLSSGRTGTGLFEANRIRWSWHAVAGGGWPSTGYIFRHNLVIHEGPGGNAHAVDMHAWRQMMSAGGAIYPFISIGGERLEIVGNVFVNDEESIARWRRQPHRLRAARRRFFERRIPPNMRDAIEVCIRGIPRDLAIVTGNWFANEDMNRAVRLVSSVGEPGRNSKANLWVYDNYYGPDAVLRGLADVSRARIHFRDPPLEMPQDPKTRRWLTERIAVLRTGDVWRPEVEIEMPPGVAARRIIFRLGEHEQVFDSPPEPGSVTFATEAMEPGVLIFTVEIEDERDILSRHDMALTLEPPENTGESAD